jgi:REP element-mobilizing transposase RayT
VHHFGEIRDKQMNLSIIGRIALGEWTKSFILRKELQCDAFQIMPNHIHAVLTLVNLDGGNSPHHKYKNIGMAYRPPRSISSFVSGFKSAVTSKLIAAGLTKKTIWQPRFHDRIIRNQHEYNQIIRYIRENVLNWTADQSFTVGPS